jgi:hypothetical protein
VPEEAEEEAEGEEGEEGPRLRFHDIGSGGGLASRRFADQGDGADAAGGGASCTPGEGRGMPPPLTRTRSDPFLSLPPPPPPPPPALRVLTSEQMYAQEGFLLKQGSKGLVRTFKKRWFRLAQGRLCYMKSPRGEELGSVGVEDFLRVYASPSNRAHRGGKPDGWMFVLQTTSRSFNLKAPSEVDMVYWIDGLKKYRELFLSRRLGQREGSDARELAFDFQRRLSLHGIEPAFSFLSSSTASVATDAAFTDELTEAYRRALIPAFSISLLINWLTVGHEEIAEELSFARRTAEERSAEVEELRENLQSCLAIIVSKEQQIEVMSFAEYGLIAGRASSLATQMQVLTNAIPRNYPRKIDNSGNSTNAYAQKPAPSEPLCCFISLRLRRGFASSNVLAGSALYPKHELRMCKPYQP